MMEIMSIFPPVVGGGERWVLTGTGPKRVTATAPDVLARRFLTDFTLVFRPGAP
jgi:hypothetical protein